MKKLIAVCSLVLCAVLMPTLYANANKLDTKAETAKTLIEKNISNKTLYREVLSKLANYENIPNANYFKFVGDITNKVLGDDLKGKNNIALKFDEGVLHIYTCDDIKGLDVAWKHHVVKDIVPNEDGSIKSFKKEPTTDTVVTEVDLKGKTAIMHAKSIGGTTTGFIGSASSGNTSSTVVVKKTVEPVMGMTVGANRSADGVEVPVKFDANVPFDMTIVSKEPVNEYGIPLQVDRNFSTKFKFGEGEETELVNSKDGFYSYINCNKKFTQLVITPNAIDSNKLPVGTTTFGFDLIMSPRGL